MPDSLATMAATRIRSKARTEVKTKVKVPKAKVKIATSEMMGTNREVDAPAIQCLR